MSCLDDTSVTSRYQYSHDETATIKLYPSLVDDDDNDDDVSSLLISRVSLESTSTLRSSIPLFHPRRGDTNSDISTTTWDISDGALSNNGTPFSKQVLQLLSQYPLQRLLIRVGDVASSAGSIIDNNSNDDERQQLQQQQEERARGPSGTSILATFTHNTKNSNNNNTKHEEIIRLYYKHQYTSLLRTLLHQNLFPPCGAPLDSLRVRKHGHSIMVNTNGREGEERHDNNTSMSTTVNVESYLAADAATFCNPGIQSLLLSNNNNKEYGNSEGGWAAATNNGACHSSNDAAWGIFDSLFSSSSSSLGVKKLSELLLGGSGLVVVAVVVVIQEIPYGLIYKYPPHALPHHSMTILKLMPEVDEMKNAQ
jgi:hypothetical protein